MTLPAVLSSTTVRKTAVGILLLIAGIVAGIVSVYSDSRAGCATWVTVALVLTLAAGLALRPVAGHRDDG